MKKTIGVDFFSQVKMLSCVEKYEDALYFIISQANIDKNLYERNIYRWQNGHVRQMTNTNNVSRYSSHPSGLRYLKHIEEKSPWFSSTAIMELPYDGGEAIEKWRLPYAVQEIKWVDDSHFFFTASENLKIKRLLASGLSQEEVSDKMTKDSAECREFVEVPFWFNGGGDISEIRSVLYYYHEGQIDCLSSDQENIQMDQWIPSLQRLFYTSQRIENGLAKRYNQLYSYTLQDGHPHPHHLFEQEVYYDGVYEIDAQRLLLLAGLHEQYGDGENPRCFIWYLEDNHLEQIYDGDRYSLGNSVGSDVKMGNRSSDPIFTSDGFYVIATDEDHAPIIKIGYDKTVTPVTTGLEMVQEMIPTDDGMIVIAMTEQHVNELYHVNSSGQFQPLTNLNADLEEQYTYYHPETIYFTNENGVRIKGWVILPDHFDEHQKCPAILDIHGGPKTVYGPHFFHEMQWFAANGYAVLFTNPTGSDGRGNLFSDIRGKYGTVDYRDLMTFVDHALAAYPCIDPDRLGVTGGSYGGFMTNWIIGHTNRFKAAASQRSIASWLIFENTSDIGYTFGVDQMQSDQWHDFNLLWNQSPIQFAPQVQTPTLFIHSDEDTRCWMAEGISMFYALKRHGVPAKLCLFKGENHELSRSGKPQNRIRRLEEILNWMNLYLGDSK